MSEHVTTPAKAASTAGRRPAAVFWWATAATGVAAVAIGVFGTLAHRGFGRVPFSVPAWPWYHSDPFYLFWDPRWPSAWVALALAALDGGPAAWRAPLTFTGEYPQGVGQVGDIASFLGEFPQRLASLPSHAAGHPAGVMVLYALLGRMWPGL